MSLFRRCSRLARYVLLPLYALLGALPALITAASAAAAEPAHAEPVPEDVYRGELLAYPGPWGYGLPKHSIVLVRDQDLDDLQDPDKDIDLSLGHDKFITSLRKLCVDLQARGGRTMVIAYDQFFAQYRPGQKGPRRYTPDSPEFIERVGQISRFASQYGIGLELSLLSPLEIGQAWWRETKQPATWMHYRKGVRDPQTGDFSVGFWRQKKWTNNKGSVTVHDAGVRVFAFKEQLIGGPQIYVDPASIVEITSGVQVRELPGLESRVAVRAVASGSGHTEVGELNRVLVVQQYRVDEMDYFSPDALPFLNRLIDNYADAGVRLNALYSDEMHIQQDWTYDSHHDDGQFAVRYVSPHLQEKFARLYGEQYRDFAKWLVYFCYGQEDSRYDVLAAEPLAHVWGTAAGDVQATALFRARYYHLLQDEVVDLFAAAKRHAEQRMGHKLEARAHATWAQSPVIDRIVSDPVPQVQSGYEYTSNYLWSNTVHQASAACADYFKWGDYLTGNGTDHPEGGWLDRNYYAAALAASLGMLNDTPNAYCAHWGHPGPIQDRRTAIAEAFGTPWNVTPPGAVQEMRHRDVNVLMLYPLDLVACEERFGSWMSQYGYANLITADKLLERGRVEGGAIVIDEAGGVTRRFTTVVAQFEPFPPAALLEQWRRLVEAGGTVIWSGPPPVLTREGGDALTPWMALFGVNYTPHEWRGIRAPGRIVTFKGSLAAVEPMTVLTGFMMDRLYAVNPAPGVEVVAESPFGAVGTLRKAEAGAGRALFLGFRPRDDQSKSLGYETRTWFTVLDTLGAYPPTGKFAGVNDNTEHLSRTTPYLVTRFPDGGLAIVPHLSDLPETWPGGFSRDPKEDEELMKHITMPSNELHLKGFQANGRTVDYEGSGLLSFRADAQGRPLALFGNGQRITIDGTTTAFSSAPVAVAWAPVGEDRRTTAGTLLQIWCTGETELTLPTPQLPPAVRVFAEGVAPGSRGEAIPCRREGEQLILKVPASALNRWLYVLPGA